MMADVARIVHPNQARCGGHFHLLKGIQPRIMPTRFRFVHKGKPIVTSGHAGPPLVRVLVHQIFIARAYNTQIHIAILQKNLMQIHKIRTETVVIGTILKIPLDILIQNHSFVNQRNRGEQADRSSANLVDCSQVSGFIVIECADGRGKAVGRTGT